MSRNLIILIRNVEVVGFIAERPCLENGLPTPVALPFANATLITDLDAEIGCPAVA